jgi:carbon storage regulator CsrA
MLILTCRLGESLRISGDIVVTVTVLEVKGNHFKIGTGDPKEELTRDSRENLRLPTELRSTPEHL